MLSFFLAAALQAAGAVSQAPLILWSKPRDASPVYPAMLPAQTEVFLRLNEEINGRQARTGEMFSLSLTHDVMVEGHVVIPRGTRAVGEVTWRTGKGAFGKSGKIEIELRYLDVGGQRLPIHGKYRQEGEGATVETIGTAVLAGPFAALVTGKSAVIRRGREFSARTMLDVPVALPGRATEKAEPPPPPPVAITI